ncbi:hypothetical protein U6G28_03605 [Actinomycetaceae bacterium MB13-C1-2]|nr:hypothetical protein U6G28_03605 [Actinomycetaceae bacterium MB13-C1-2]
MPKVTHRALRVIGPQHHRTERGLVNPPSRLAGGPSALNLRGSVDVNVGKLGDGEGDQLPLVVHSYYLDRVYRQVVEKLLPRQRPVGVRGHHVEIREDPLSQQRFLGKLHNGTVQTQSSPYATFVGLSRHWRMFSTL